MSGPLKQKTLKGIFWNSLERFATAGVGFAITVVLARILSPADYGVVAMLSVFTTVCQCFIDGGFVSALVRKTDRTDADEATVFYFSIVTSVICYLLLYLTAPWIAAFYATPILVPIARTIGLTLIISSFALIPRVILISKIDFKTQAKIAIIALLLSGPAGIFLAYHGWGVWALVWQSVISSVVGTLLLCGHTRWIPRARFSNASFCELFSFGSKLLASRLLNVLYGNIYPLVIGKFFSLASLGLYDRASHMATLPSAHLNGILQSVTFPSLCAIQHEDERLAANYRRILRLAAFVIFPLMVGLAAVADPLIRLLLTDKWEACIPLLQLISFAMMWYPIHSLNLTLLEVKGRSDIFLRLEVYKKIIGIIILCVTIPFGLLALCAGAVVTSLMCLALNTYYTGKIIHLGYWQQMHDLYPTLLNSLMMGACAYGIQFLLPGLILKLCAGVALGVIYYLVSNILLKTTEWNDIFELIQRKSS